MAKQERAARATKAAAAKAEKIIGEATAKAVTCKGCQVRGQRLGDKVKIVHKAGCAVAAKRQATQPTQKAAAPKKAVAATRTAPAPRSSPENDLAAECRRLRDEQGMAWWLIGKTLGLPGAGNSAATGKGGAHQARRLYASTGKEVPRTRAPRGKAAEPKGPGQVGTKTERKIALTLGEQVIPEDLTDEEVVLLVRGRWIEWGVNLADLAPGPDEWYNHEARVHPEFVMVDEEPSKDGSRTLRFREFLGRDQYGNLMSGPTRTVRLRAIHTVRG